MFVKPAPGVLLRDPVTKQLLSAAPVEGVKKPVTIVPAEGMEVGDFDGYWLRRIRDKDAVKVEPPASPIMASAPVTNSGPLEAAEQEEK